MGRRSSDVEKLPQYVTGFTDRHGKRRYMYRRTGQKALCLKNHPGTPKHPSNEYKALLAGQRPANDVKPVEAGTIRDLVNRYYSTPKYLSPGLVTQEKVRARLEDFCAGYGKLKVTGLRFNHVEVILAKKAQPGVNAKGKKIGGPNAAKSLEKDLVRILDLAVKLEWIQTNPARLAEGVKVPKTSGFHTWTEEEIAQYRAFYPLGTMGRLAIEIILWTLLRRGDASQFGPKHRKGGKINTWSEKQQKWSWLPEPARLTAAIEAMSHVGLTVYLLNDHGQPFASPAVFGNWFRRRCDAAGLFHCSAHGLRKATGRRAAEAGGTQQELKAAGNWSQDKDVAIYTAAADQERLADGVMTRVAARDEG